MARRGALALLLAGCASAQLASLFRYDLNYTTSLPLAYGWEEQLFVAALAGLWNRHAPSLLVRLSASDDAWLAAAQRPGGWLAGARVEELAGLPALVAAFAPLGVVLYDPAVPATSMLAATVAGAEALLPIAYKPGDPDALYERLVAGGPRLRVGRSLVGVFNASGAGGSAKAAAYAWAVRELMPAADARFLAYAGDAFCSGPAYARDAGAYDKIEVANLDWTVAQRGFAFDLGVWADEAPVDDPAQPRPRCAPPAARPPHAPPPRTPRSPSCTSRASCPGGASTSTGTRRTRTRASRPSGRRAA